MAAAKVVLGLIRLFCVINILDNVVFASDLGRTKFIPSINVVSLQTYDGSFLTNDDASRTAYHIHKRSITSPPIKKAFSSSEKKLSTKLATESNIQLKTLEYDAKSKLENATTSNSTDTETTTVNSTAVEDQKNVSSSILPDSTMSSTTVTASSTSESTISTTGSGSTMGSPLSTVTPFVTTSQDTLTKPSNITNTTVDHHVYYNSTLFLEEEKSMSFWVDFDTLPQDKVTVHQMLSDSHRKAATVTLTFDFPFYGHPLRNITIATGGFVYMGDYMHSWLAATQYIAPLMANFDTSLSDESTVRYFDNGTAFVIEWHEVTLQDEKKGGNFTFQTTLLKNGNIIFVYKVIPVSVTDIGDEAHPVKVGLSDAYVIDRIIYFIRRKTIYEYHRIDMKKEEIGNNTAIYFTALKTCMNYQDCKSCMTGDIGLDCVWCETAKRCSDGLDRLRQDWLQSKCDVEKDTVNCSLLPLPDTNPYVQTLTDSPYKPYTFFPQTSKPDIHFETTTNRPMPYKPSHSDDNGASSSARVAEESSSVGVGSVVAILLILAVVLGGLVWVGYAYRNPHTSSGQLLIRYRPTQWRFRSGEARYTAASVHM